VIVKNDGHPSVGRARMAPEARGFVHWARFPFFTVTPDGASNTVTMDDARYAPAVGRSWAAVVVSVPAEVARTGSLAAEDDAAREPRSWMGRVAAALARACVG
jgi:hypothetical protein